MLNSGTFFIQLAVILGLVSVFGIVVRQLKLPLLVAYLLTGLSLATLSTFDIKSVQALTYLPGVGVAFALYFIGMELNLSELKSLGLPIVITGLGQIVIASIFGFSAAVFLGLPQNEAVFLGLGLSVSSTIVVVKLLSERRDLASLFGKLALGILLLEDLMSILIMMGLTVGSSVLHLGLYNSWPVIDLLLKAGLLFATAWVFAKFILPRVLRLLAHSSELLFLSAIAWCFIYVAFAVSLGFSVVIGAFLAGVALANSSYHYEIQGKVRPLRDFFVTLFFVYLGAQVSFVQLGSMLPLIGVFVLYALVIKPLIFLLFLGAFGFRRHTIFQTAISLSQISEFSLIILILGQQMGVVSASALSAMALTGLISVILSSVMITYSKRIYRFVSPIVGFFEHQVTDQSKYSEAAGERFDHIVLIGAHRMGGPIASFLLKEKVPFVVLDFNPKIVESLAGKGVEAYYGDISDPEVGELLNLASAKLIISTASDLADNLMLLNFVKENKFQLVMVVRAAGVEEAKKLYKAGADYVILPELVAGDFILEALKSHWPKLDFFKQRREIELDKLAKQTSLVL